MAIKGDKGMHTEIESSCAIETDIRTRNIGLVMSVLLLPIVPVFMYIDGNHAPDQQFDLIMKPFTGQALALRVRETLDRPG
jgi:hypothetical protein